MDIANSKLGRFIGNGLSDDAARNLVASAKSYADNRNTSATGAISPSSVNVEDFALIVTGLLKGGTKALGQAFTKDLADKYINLASAQRTIHILAGDATGGATLGLVVSKVLPMV